jgi:hypothetical protein
MRKGSPLTPTFAVTTCTGRRPHDKIHVANVRSLGAEPTLEYP